MAPEAPCWQNEAPFTVAIRKPNEEMVARCMVASERHREPDQISYHSMPPVATNPLQELAALSQLQMKVERPMLATRLQSVHPY